MGPPLSMISLITFEFLIVKIHSTTKSTRFQQDIRQLLSALFWNPLKSRRKLIDYNTSVSVAENKLELPKIRSHFYSPLPAYQLAPSKIGYLSYNFQ